MRGYTQGNPVGTPLSILCDSRRVSNLGAMLLTIKAAPYNSVGCVDHLIRLQHFDVDRPKARVFKVKKLMAVGVQILLIMVQIRRTPLTHVGADTAPVAPAAAQLRSLRLQR